MGQLTWKLVLPLTVISFVTVTKWWYAIVVDGPDDMLTGFPLPYVCSGWHTSMSLQIFLTEFFVDLLTYFSFWFVSVFCVNRFLKPISIPKSISIGLLTVSGLIVTGMTLLAINPDNIYVAKRDFDMKVLATGYKFIWQDEPDAEFYDHHLARYRNEKTTPNTNHEK